MAMIEVRIHGRGGQGAVTSAEVLAQAAIAEGKSAQAFPSFGPERRGAPVIAFARVSGEPIRNRTAVRQPSVVVVLDPSLLSLVRFDEGMPVDGVLIVNTAQSADELRREHGISCRIAVVNANKIAREELGRVITNTALLGALVAAVPCVSPSSIEAALEERFGPLAAKNIKAFRRAMEETTVIGRETLAKAS
jgi:pyruvate ferredoxin oxidoreductase gamma subunit